MRDVQRDPVADEGVHDAALERVGRDRGGAAQVQRVVRDEQPRAERDGLVRDGLHGVDGEQHPVHLRAGVAAHRPDRVPLLGPRAGP